MTRYSISESLRLAYSVMLTRVRFPGARLVRRPIFVRGRKHGQFGPGLTTGYGCRFDLGGDDEKSVTLVVGSDCRMGDYVHLVASQSVVIGRNCLMASHIFISDTSHGVYQGSEQSSPSISPHDRQLFARNVEIGDNVWIGESVSILPGAKIGSGSIVNAHAVVTKEFPEDVMLAGVPARVIKAWNPNLRKWEQRR